MKFLSPSFICLSMISCTETVKVEYEEEDITVQREYDNDGDGYLASEECDDNNAIINPGAIEICDGIDNNCNGEVDEGVSLLFYADTDGDESAIPLL